MEWTVIRERRAKHLTRTWFLVLTVVCSEFSPADADANDFLCRGEARKMMNKVKELEQELVGCSAARSLSTPVRLPCTRVHVATWRQKPVSERSAEVLLSLRLLVQDLHQAKIQNPSGCTNTLLHNLKHNVNNYILTLTQLHTQGGSDRSEGSDRSDGVKVPGCPAQESQNLGSVLKRFELLISRKLEYLMTDMMKACPPDP
ncbi:thrombopoietin [Trichomycterus rosablanca]|uniref:thrombopoietin n=1 Tax=Trichomycterus rosablanca TaxID=2290929 RepID=UPI002F35CB26